MAVVIVACPECSARLKLDEALRGKNVKCGKCATRFLFDGASATPPSANTVPPPPAAPAAREPVPAKERPRGEDGIPLDWEPGDIILDQYEVKQLPGTKQGYAEGGMGRVNLVHHRGWGKDLAVKSVLPAKSARTRDIENFKTEAEQWVEKIGLHPNIVACHYVRVLGGVPRVFIEYVDGGTLNDWITSKERGRTPRLYEGGLKAALARILDVAIQTAWGLHYVHELPEGGLIHQDVKPLNVMMTADGVAKVTDFGLAGARAVAFEGNEPRPQSGTILATWGGMTPAYCSPEQAEIAARKQAGLPREQWPKLTRRTDIWSWAASVLHMLLGKIAWPSGQVAHLGLRRQPDQPHLPPMPLEVKDLLCTCLQKRPEERPHELMQVADALRAVYQQETGQPYPREQPKPDELLADTLNNRAVSLFDLGKQVAAEQKWQEALQVDPLHPEATYNWGLIQWRSARLTDLELLTKLREVRTSSADAGGVDYLMGLVHLERTDAQAAVHLLTKAVEAGTSRPEISSALVLGQSLRAPSEQLPRTFEGHTREVTSVSWNPDGRCALSGSHDKTVRLWEVSSGKCLRTFRGHKHGVESVSWSPDGRCALSGGGDNMLRLWEVSSGKCLRTFQGHTDRVTSVAWSPDGRCALSGSRDKMLRLWEVSSGKCLRTFEGHTWWVTAVSWSPDGRFALSLMGNGLGERPGRLWEVSSGKCLNTFEAYRGSALAWSPDGRCALAAGEHGAVLLWEVSSGKCLRTFRGHKEWVKSVSWSPDGRYALSGSLDETLRLWQVSSGTCLRTFEGHTNNVNAVSWSPDGRYALSGSEDKTLRLWGITFAKQPVPLVTSMGFALNSPLYPPLLQQVRDALAHNPAVAASFLQEARQQPGCSRREDALELARLLSRSLAHHTFVEGWEKRTFEGHTGSVTSVSWSPDGRHALSGSEDKTLRLWEVSSGKCLRTFEGHAKHVTAVSWSPDGRCALSGSRDNMLRLWDVSSGKCLCTFAGEVDSSVAWSPDGRFALSGSSDTTVRLWEVSSGKCLRTFEGHAEYVTAVSWSPDGRCALSGSRDNMLRLWEVSSGKCLRTFEGHAEYVTAVSWSPDGRCALSGSEDDTMRLWDVSSGKCLCTFAGEVDSSVAWSPDGRFALSGSRDKMLRLWEVSSGKCLRTLGKLGRFAHKLMRLFGGASGKCVRTFEGHTGFVNSVSWSPDGRFALSGSEDKTLRLWELDWEFEPNQPADWDEGARPFLNAFLTIHTPYVDGLIRRGKPTWTEDDVRRLVRTLGCAGYGWLRPEGVRHELAKMAQNWKGPPPIRGKRRGWLDWLFGR